MAILIDFQSNYPQAQSSYGYQDHYVSSGPPPPPGGFYNQPAYPGSAYQGSAYQNYSAFSKYIIFILAKQFGM